MLNSKKGEFKNGFIRGGNWNNGTNAGAFALNLNNTTDNRNNNIGFRCASDLYSIKYLVFCIKYLV